LCPYVCLDASLAAAWHFGAVPSNIKGKSADLHSEQAL
jgi:hypothetical protein